MSLLECVIPPQKTMLSVTFLVLIAIVITFTLLIDNKIQISIVPTVVLSIENR